MNHDPDKYPPGASPVSRRYGKRMIAIAWVAVLVILFLFFDEHVARLYNPNPAPVSHLLEDGGTRVVLLRNRYGHYVATGSINGHAVDFLVDTGASDVNVPLKVAAHGARAGSHRT